MHRYFEIRRIDGRYTLVDKKTGKPVGTENEEKDREEYLNYTKKEYHPDSYTIKKELDEWENNSPIFAEFEQQKFDATVRSVLYVSLWFTIGLVVIKALLL